MNRGIRKGEALREDIVVQRRHLKQGKKRGAPNPMLEKGLVKARVLDKCLPLGVCQVGAVRDEGQHGAADIRVRVGGGVLNEGVHDLVRQDAKAGQPDTEGPETFVFV